MGIEANRHRSVCIGVAYKVAIYVFSCSSDTISAWLDASLIHFSSYSPGCSCRCGCGNRGRRRQAASSGDTSRIQRSWRTRRYRLQSAGAVVASGCGRGKPVLFVPTLLPEALSFLWRPWSCKGVVGGVGGGNRREEEGGKWGCDGRSAVRPLRRALWLTVPGSIRLSLITNIREGRRSPVWKITTRTGCEGVKGQSSPATDVPK